MKQHLEAGCLSRCGREGWMKRPLHRFSVSACAMMIAATMLFSGCLGDGLNLVPVEGTLTLDGQPLAEAAIMFMPKSGTGNGTAVTDENPA